MQMLEKITRTYRSAAFITFNLLIFLVAINIALAMVFFVYDRIYNHADQRIMTYREKYTDLDAYSVLSKDEANHFLDEQDAMQAEGFQYEPWVQFRNPDVHGTYLNTDARGWRKTSEPAARQGEPFRVFIFGGSTTFGYGVPDDYTIPSYIQKILERMKPNLHIQVRNFGQGFYYSSQELALFLSLTKAGDIPDAVVFIDGANDTHQLSLGSDQPYFSSTIDLLWKARAGEQPVNLGKYAWIPVIRLALGIAKHLNPSAVEVHSDQKDIGQEEEKNTDYVISRYQNNMEIIRALCQAHGIHPLFVWQPVSFFKYDRNLLRTIRFNDHWVRAYANVYSSLEHYDRPDFLFLGNMLEDVSKKVFVDNIHYNEHLNERIAEIISKRLLRNLTPSTPG